MADQIVITEKTSQAKDVRAAVGSRYGDILPAEGHLLDLLEPEDVVPAWKRWAPILLRPKASMPPALLKAATKPPSSKPRTSATNRSPCSTCQSHGERRLVASKGGIL